MKIETRFEIDEEVILIDSNKIVILSVKDIQYTNKTVKYSFLVSSAVSLLDKDKIIYRDEDECFKSAAELIEYYNIK